MRLRALGKALPLVSEISLGTWGLSGDAYGPVAEAEASMAVPGSRVQLCAPVGEQELVVCAGANYRAHLLEMGEDLPDKAAWFVKNSRSVVGPGVPIALPAENAPSDKNDFARSFNSKYSGGETQN